MTNVVITGGNGDIAIAISKKLQKEGQYNVYRPSKYELDVTDINSVDRYFKNIKVDILINNAGMVIPQTIKDCNIDIIKSEIDVNLFGTFNCTACVLKYNKYAQIINIGSSAATKVHGTWSGYCASKAAIVMATKCWAEDGINVICISPGRTATKMRKGLYPDEDQLTLLNPKDFAEVVFLAIKGKYAIGENLNVNLQNVGDLIND